MGTFLLDLVSIWVAWIEEYLMKGRSFWILGVPHNSSWCGRKLLKLREFLRPLIKFEVGDGKLIHMWLENWHPHGTLFEKYGFRVIYDAHSRIEARLSTVMKNGVWCWRHAISDELLDIQGSLPDIRLDADKPLGQFQKKGSILVLIRGNFVEKTFLLWIGGTSCSSPCYFKTSFCLWLVMRNCLATGDRLANWGYNGDVNCIYCRNRLDSRYHLFFDGSFCSRIWNEGMSRCNVTNPPIGWDDVVRMGVSDWKKKTLRGNLCR